MAERGKSKRRVPVGDKRREPVKDKQKPGPVEDKQKEKQDADG